MTSEALYSKQAFAFTFSSEPLAHTEIPAGSRALKEYAILKQNDVALYGGHENFYRIPLDLLHEDLGPEADEVNISSMADVGQAKDDGDVYDYLTKRGFVWDEYCAKNIGSRQPMFDLEHGDIFVNVFRMCSVKGEDDLGISCFDHDWDLGSDKSELIASLDASKIKPIRTNIHQNELPSGHYVEESYHYKKPVFGPGYLSLVSPKPFDPSMLRLLVSEDDASSCTGISYGLVEPEFSLIDESGGYSEWREYYVFNHAVYQTINELSAAIEWARLPASGDNPNG